MRYPVSIEIRMMMVRYCIVFCFYFCVIHVLVNLCNCMYVCYMS